MKKVLTVGVFDYFHYGHLRLFQRAKSLGDYLIVAVQDGEYIIKYKPEAQIYYTTQQRIEMVQALSVVDEVCIYYDVDKIVQEVDFDIFAIGGDQKHAGFVKAVEWCKSHGKKVIRLDRTPNVSSTNIKSQIDK